MLQPSLMTLLITLAALCAPLACSVGMSALTTSDRICVRDSHAENSGSFCTSDSIGFGRGATSVRTVLAHFAPFVAGAWPRLAVTTLCAASPPPSSTRL